MCWFLGYARIIFAFVAFYYVDDPYLCVPFYFVSSFLDALDGYAARALNQSTRLF